MLSRFGLESNFLPFLFLLSFACLLASIDDNRWFPVACFLLALCLYTYGTAYLIVPLFLAYAIWVLLSSRLLSTRFLVTGLIVLGAAAVPIVLFLCINTFGWHPLQLGPVSIPRLPEQARYLSETAGIQAHPVQALANNTVILARILATETDGLIYNSFEPYGYFYRLGLALGFWGFVVLARQQAARFDARVALFLGWPAVCVIFGFLQPVNINRVNVLFIAILMCAAVGIAWFAGRVRFFLPIAVAGLLAAFGLFLLAYLGGPYRALAEHKFHTGLLPAIHFASSIASGPVCVTGRIDQPYIYVLFSEKPDPRRALQTIQYAASVDGMRSVRSLARYEFGADNCDTRQMPVYVLTTEELPPHMGGRYQYEFFDQFVVYYPRP
jgi:hypothetical protein